MAHPSHELIDALRTTAKRLHDGAHYAWGNHGSCNCGNLLQTVTELSSSEILSYSRNGTGEWTELALEFCPVSDAPLDLLITRLGSIGLTPSDIHCIEYLEDKQVLDQLPGGFRWLRRNQREDVILYMETMANMLEDKLARQVTVAFDALFVPVAPNHRHTEKMALTMA
jgi:hypothetical protein